MMCRKRYTEEMEKQVVNWLTVDKLSANEIIRVHHVSGRKIILIKKKYGLWGA